MIENQDQTDGLRNNVVKTRGRPFERGNSGRPKGAQNQTTRMLQRLMEADAETIVNVVVEGAKKGDWTAAKLVLDRIVAPRKDNPVLLHLPQITTLDDAALAMSIVIEAVSTGNISPNEGSSITNLISSYTQAVEISHLEKRLALLESRSEKK